ncbi:putative cystathionine gamma-lyase 2 [Chrysoperla carnea]|uniref:putative cystathionine gamma-lyase 2 n=1 Tax=Chrysoperla carnea TaxID=189513 RepID=UPI001D0912AC|nr:putative cystathionine gamma-lyase 2 [Chrysoperla carnea]
MDSDENNNSKVSIQTILENSLASLDNGKYGICFPSCVSAMTAVFSLLKVGDHIICGDDIFGGTCNLLRKVFPQFKIDVDFIDMTDTLNVENAIKPNTKLIFYETPTNPTLKVTDIHKIAKIAKSKNLIHVVENTFLTSYFQKPLNLGADIVLYSLTKYMNGHSDVFMGAIVTNSDGLYKQLKLRQDCMGINPSSLDCHLVFQSLKTLPLRMRQHMFNGQRVAEFLDTHSSVQKVLYTGLSSHPQYELSKKQTSGHCGIVSFYIKGSKEESTKFLKSLKLIQIAVSFGGYESIIQLPKYCTSNPVPETRRAKLGINDSLLRLSVGLENVDDLIIDLNQALNSINL